MSAHHVDGTVASSKPSHARFLWQSSEPHLEELCRAVTSPGSLPGLPPRLPVDDDLIDTPDYRAEWTQARTCLLASAVPYTVAATALAAAMADHRKVIGGAAGEADIADGAAAFGAFDAAGAASDRALDESGEDTYGWSDEEAPGSAQLRRRGRAATAFGRAVHSVLQVVAFDSTPDERVETCAQMALLEGVAGLSGEIEQSVAAALSSPALRHARMAARQWRELAVVAPVGDRAVEGFVDLLYESPDGLVVVDYKTDQLEGAAALRAAITRYAPQVAAYALAVEHATGRDVHHCTFVFAGMPGGHEHLLLGEAFEAAKREVVAWLSSPVQVPGPAVASGRKRKPTGVKSHRSVA